MILPPAQWASQTLAQAQITPEGYHRGQGADDEPTHAGARRPIMVQRAKSAGRKGAHHERRCAESIILHAKFSRLVARRSRQANALPTRHTLLPTRLQRTAAHGTIFSSRDIPARHQIMMDPTLPAAFGYYVYEKRSFC